MTNEWMSRRAWLGVGAAAVSASACRVDRGADATADAQEQSAQVLDVRQFGATGNGRDDDYPAIARALDTARKTEEYGGGTRGAVVFFPPGIYRITRPLDCNGRQFNLRGAGPFQSTIRGDTGDGGAIIEAVAGRYSSFRDLLLETRYMRNPSTVGILIGRDPAGSQAGDMHFEDLRVQMDPIPRANGGNGTVALYNIAAEIQGGQGCTFGGDVGAFFSSGNVWNLRPRHAQIIGREASMAVVRFAGHNWFYGIHGPAIRLQAGASFHFEGFLSCLAGTPQYPQLRPHDCAIEILAAVTDLSWRGYMEGFERLMRINRVPVTGLRLEAFASRTRSQPFIQLQDGGSIDGGSIDITPTQDTNGVENFLIDSQAGTQSVVRNTHIWLRNQKIRLQGAGRFTNNLVIAETSLAQAAANVTAGQVSGNLILASDGVEAAGNRLAGAGPSAARPSAASVGAGAQYYDTRLYRPVWSDGQAWRDAMGNAV